ncbi:hypothetical protein B0H15DRAFT_927782 [Mycena belliarum]|uniref:Uncharacterized protein n=1 Tax=Mycena belliarum TaxID=1033014 RepID=A0AAD6XVL3_9AGAR|nr:hypothetical protein B0H15DRAFT_927782 [Mycena belliae]
MPMAPTLRRPPPDLSTSRAAQRKQRLLELENEQRIEDAEALKMTEEQRLSLFHSFRSVKFEWSDLDGMRSVRRRYNAPINARVDLRPAAAVPAPASAPPPPQLQAPPHPQAQFAVLTNARLAAFGADDTICARGAPLPLPPASPSPHAVSPSPSFATSPSPHATPSPHSPRAASVGTQLVLPPTHHHHTANKPKSASGGKPKPRKARAPVRGLFASTCATTPPQAKTTKPAAPRSTGEKTRTKDAPPSPIRVPRLPRAAYAYPPALPGPAASAFGCGEEEDEAEDQDVREDEGEDGDVEEGDAEEDGDDDEDAAWVDVESFPVPALHSASASFPTSTSAAFPTAAPGLHRLPVINTLDTEAVWTPTPADADAAWTPTPTPTAGARQAAWDEHDLPTPVPRCPPSSLSPSLSLSPSSPSESLGLGFPAPPSTPCTPRAYAYAYYGGDALARCPARLECAHPHADAEPPAYEDEDALYTDAEGFVCARARASAWDTDARGEGGEGGCVMRVPVPVLHTPHGDEDALYEHGAEDALYDAPETRVRCDSSATVTQRGTDRERSGCVTPVPCLSPTSLAAPKPASASLAAPTSLEPSFASAPTSPSFFVPLDPQPSFAPEPAPASPTSLAVGGKRKR